MNNPQQQPHSVTPKGDITWYVKWISSIIVLCAIVVRSSGISELQWLDILLSLIGGIGWLFVSIRWNDRALILLNSVITVTLAIGLLRAWS